MTVFMLSLSFTVYPDHPDADLQNVPGDLVTTSGSGLDPDIMLQNAEYQLDRVASRWAADTKRDPATVRREIDQILQSNARAPFGGLAGEKMVRVLEVNLVGSFRRYRGCFMPILGPRTVARPRPLFM